MTSKERFIEIYNSCIKREGADKLLEYLMSSQSDFFTAPASARFHSSYEGGLCEHSINVFNRYVKILTMEYGENFTDKISMESVAIISPIARRIDLLSESPM